MNQVVKTMGLTTKASYNWVRRTDTQICIQKIFQYSVHILVVLDLHVNIKFLRTPLNPHKILRGRLMCAQEQVFSVITDFGSFQPSPLLWLCSARKPSTPRVLCLESTGAADSRSLEGDKAVSWGWGWGIFSPLLCLALSWVGRHGRRLVCVPIFDMVFS